MHTSIQHISAVLQAKATIVTDCSIAYLLIDSRKIIFPETSLFFALSSPRRDGHAFVEDVYHQGVRNFVVSDSFNTEPFPQANFLQVGNVLQALQTLAAHHRQQFNYPVIGITGSNGKTIVKEWLYQLLQPDYKIVRSPRSYNSQVGVPLSVWQMNAQYNLGIFEAGISEKGEMQALANIIYPTIGIFTNIGEAHQEGFANNAEKIAEKLQLFAQAQQLIYNKDSIGAWLNLGAEAGKLLPNRPKLFAWSRQQPADLVVQSTTTFANRTQLQLQYSAQQFAFDVPFTDAASVENAITCCCTLLVLGYEPSVIAQRMPLLQPVEMRMQLKKAINNCYILNDSYSNDVSSLTIALDYLQQQSGNQPTTVILSDVPQAGIPDAVLYAQIAQALQHRNIHRFIGIGERIAVFTQLFADAVPKTAFYNHTAAFLQQATHHQFNNEYILLKGARVFAFEQINRWLEQKVHQTVLEINLTAMAHNLKAYQKHLKPSTKLMAMVKAFSYGSGSAEVARLLQYYKVDYLAVAYADEGIDLRKAGISLPIMVMNADEASFEALITYNLEPEIYSFYMYHAFAAYLQQQGITHFPVHIKLNTGMNRLGFEVTEITTLAQLLVANPTMVVKSVFSHLVGSEAAETDNFTQHQSALFETASAQMESILGYRFLKHLANSSGIFRHPYLQYDMVRLGIGLYGVDSANGNQIQLETVATLKTTIAQIRTVKAHDTVGYNRRGVLTRDSRIATLRIGYADGFSRQLGNRKGQVFLHGLLAPVIGNVCMDMIMVDVTDIQQAQANDVVEIFGKYLPVQQIAAWSNTIAYEMLTSVSQRVKRVYVEE